MIYLIRQLFITLLKNKFKRCFLTSPDFFTIQRESLNMFKKKTTTHKIATAQYTCLTKY